VFVVSVIVYKATFHSFPSNV